MICKHCRQPIWFNNGEWKHNEKGSWYYRCQRTDNYGTDAEPLHDCKLPSEKSLGDIYECECGIVYHVLAITILGKRYDWFMNFNGRFIVAQQVTGE